MRYQDSNSSSLTIESPPQPLSVIGSFPTPLLNTTPAGYSPDPSSFYQPASHVFTGLDGRPRLSNTSNTGMAHVPHRNTTSLPNPGYNTRDLYSRSTPSFPRGPVHSQGSPPFTTPLRRLPLSPTPSPSIGFTSPVRMDASGYGPKGSSSSPPLGAVVKSGQLVYADSQNGPGTQVDVDIQGTIDKGFFLSDNEWTCYRRNYFSCVCSYSLRPHQPGVPMYYTSNGSAQSYLVHGFAMCISAVVAESEAQLIELVQHTPKRDKGPVARPEKIKLSPKPVQSMASHPLAYGADAHSHMTGSSRGMFDYAGGGQASFPNEYTFERIQFKQATANNGKRRAAQQYYHLMVELYADVGNQHPDGFIRVAHRKSAKMIVRGRSPGHYQTDRRGSSSSGPGGSSGTLGGYSASQVLPDYSTGHSVMPNPYATRYENQGHYGGTNRHGDMMESMISPGDVKQSDGAKDYQYFPGAIYEGADPKAGIEVYPHRADSDVMMTSMPGVTDGSLSKVKHEYENGLPSIYSASGHYQRSCGSMEAKPSSVGYYPGATMLGQSG